MKKLFVILFFISCSNTKEQHKELYITTHTYNSKNGTHSSPIKKTELFSSDFLEINLCQTRNDTSNIATKEIDGIHDVNNYNHTTIAITDINGQIINFNGATSFLNFMHNHNYEIIEQQKSGTIIKYLFKKLH